MKLLAKAVNEAFFKAYPYTVDTIGQGEGIPPAEVEAVLCKRVKMLSDGFECAVANWRLMEKEYNRLDCELRGIRRHWWQFWKRRKA